MDATMAGRTARALELLHSLSYFVPEVEEGLLAAGLSDSRMCYFAGRSAPLGAVPAGVVAATFYNFNPDAVSYFIPSAWSLASTVTIVETRYAGVARAYRRLLGDDVVASSEMAEAAALARSAAEFVPNGDGRPLYSAYAELDWPTEPHLVFWHALTLLREHRGDGHVAALLTAGLSGLEALITHTATGIGFQKEFARTRRGWSQTQWNTAVSALTERGILDANGELTADGVALREGIENTTNDRSLAPWKALGDAPAERLLELATPWKDSVVAQGVFPSGVFGPRVSS